MIRTPSKKVALLSTRQAFQYDMPVRERFDPTGYVQGTFDIEELEETKETSKTLTGTRRDLRQSRRCVAVVDYIQHDRRNWTRRMEALLWRGDGMNRLI